MPTRAEDYEVLHTIGTGSYGRCQKIRRKSDGKVSAGRLPVSAAAALSPARGERPRPLGWLAGEREARLPGLRLSGLAPGLGIQPASFEIFLSVFFPPFPPFSCFDLLRASH